MISINKVLLTVGRLSLLEASDCGWFGIWIQRFAGGSRSWIITIGVDCLRKWVKFLIWLTLNLIARSSDIHKATANIGTSCIGGAGGIVAEAWQSWGSGGGCCRRGCDDTWLLIARQLSDVLLINLPFPISRAFETGNSSSIEIVVHLESIIKLFWFCRFFLSETCCYNVHIHKWNPNRQVEWSNQLLGLRRSAKNAYMRQRGKIYSIGSSVTLPTTNRAVRVAIDAK